MFIGILHYILIRRDPDVISIEFDPHASFFKIRQINITMYNVVIACAYQSFKYVI